MTWCSAGKYPDSSVLQEYTVCCFNFLFCSVLFCFLTTSYVFLVFMYLYLSFVAQFLNWDSGNRLHSPKRQLHQGTEDTWKNCWNLWAWRLVLWIVQWIFLWIVLCFHLPFLLAGSYQSDLQGTHMPQRHSCVFACHSPPKASSGYLCKVVDGGSSIDF